MSVATRLRRIVQYGGLVRRTVGLRRARKTPAHEAARLRLVEQFGLLHGLPQKIGQILSFSELENGGAAFTMLTEGDPVLSGMEAEDLIERELGSRAAFRRIEPRGISASIGQVHRATLVDGREVAVKVQLPGIAESIATDLRALGWLTAPIGGMRRGFDIATFRGEIGDMLRAELDYGREARVMRRFGEAVEGAGMPVCVPQVIGDLCSPRVLTMTWVEGEHFHAVRSWPAWERARAGRTVLELFLRGVLQWGFVHADPHPGNYRFRRGAGGPVVGLIDFGCVKELAPALARGFGRLLAAAAARRVESEEAWAALREMGFDCGMIEPLRGRLAEIVRVLFEPFAATGPCDLRTWTPGASLAAILGGHRMAFRMAAPAGLIYLVRAFLGAVQYLRAIDTPVDWGGTLRPLLSVTACDMDRHAAPAMDPVVPVGRCLSSSLCIAVDEHGESKVRLTFGVRAVDNLIELIPDEVKPRLTERAIDLEDVVSRARACGYAPGVLFELTESSRRFRVWLE